MNNDSRERVIKLHRELKRVQGVGHIFKTSAIGGKDIAGNSAGIELYLDAKVSPDQIRKVVKYIVSSYNFDAYYYTKSHSIKVWYRNAR